MRRDDGNSIGLTGSSVFATSTFLMTFSRALNTATIVIEDPEQTGNVSLACNSVAVEITVLSAPDTDGTDDNEFVITPADRLPLGATCVLTLASSAVTDADGTPLGSAEITYTFFVASSVAPTILSLADAADTTLSATASENTTPLSALTTNPYTVTFDVPMDPDTLSTEGITLSCGGVAQTITIDPAADSDGIDDNEFVIAPSVQLPQQTSCTLTFGTGVTDAAGTALAETAFTYNTKCATSDDFSNAATFDLDSGVCWGTVGTTAFSNSGSYEISNGTLNFDGPNEHYFNYPNWIIVYKTFTSEDLTVTIEFPYGGISGIDWGNDVFALGIYEDSDDPTDYALVEHTYGEEANKCGVTPSDDGSSPCSIDDLRGFRLVKTGTTIEGFWWENSFPGYLSLGSTTVDVGATYRVGIQMEGEAGNGDNNIILIDSFTVTGGSAVGQD